LALQPYVSLGLLCYSHPLVSSPLICFSNSSLFLKLHSSSVQLDHICFLIYLSLLWRNSPTRARAISFFRFPDHRVTHHSLLLAFTTNLRVLASSF
jgi:hypothetical protein